jgi:phage terminase large subunit-like protein
VPYRKVTASRGKRLRAEPVAALYEQGRVHHVGQLGDLEEQMVSWTPEVGWSPDRLDALVWAVTDLVLSPVKKRRSVVVAA